MNKIVQKRIIATKQPHTIPSFLQNRQLYGPELAEKEVINWRQGHEQYEKLSIMSWQIKKIYKQRAQCWIENTPKVVIGQQKNQCLQVMIENPKKQLIESLQNYRRSLKIQKAIEIINTLFKLSDIYGYFYCDKMMIRQSQCGTPVVWIHQRFKQNQRQFPIRDSSVSELIFINKIKETMNSLIQFPKNSQIQTKQKLISYLQQQKSKLSSNIDQISLIKIQKRPLLIRREKSTSSSNLCKERSVKSIKLGSQPKNERFTAPSSQLKIVKIGSQKSKKFYQLFDTNRDRIKTTKFDKTEKLFDENSVKNKKSEKSVSHKLVKLNQESTDKASRKQFQAVKFLSTNVNILRTPQKVEKEETIYEQFDFQSEVLDNKTIQLKKNKQRKQSADINMVTSWIQKQKNKEISFPHSTFSTGISFSSINAQVQNTCDQDDQIERKKQPKQQNYVINHLYSILKQKQTKQKMSAEIKKIMRQSGLKIAQEDSFETEMQHILNSESSSKNIKPSPRQSGIIEEFEKLFQSFRKQESEEVSFTKEFENLLD